MGARGHEDLANHLTNLDRTSAPRGPPVVFGGL
jgi:hypothetical protein